MIYILKIFTILYTLIIPNTVFGYNICDSLKSLDPNWCQEYLAGATEADKNACDKSILTPLGAATWPVRSYYICLNYAARTNSPHKFEIISSCGLTNSPRRSDDCFQVSLQQEDTMTPDKVTGCIEDTPALTWDVEEFRKCLLQ